MSRFLFILVLGLPASPLLAIDFDMDQSSRHAPRHVDGFSSVMQVRLDDAFALAAERVYENPACNDLFPQGDGLARLLNTRYSPAPVWRERALCRNTQAAFTFVGTRQTWLCRNFAELPRTRAAVVLIHEALHYAGWSEKPRDPEALAPDAINRVVAQVCEL